MKAKRKTPEEQLQLIIQCRQSGLTDAQWCLENNIIPTSFYNWVTRLRKKGYSLPDSCKNKNEVVSIPTEIVKLPVIDDFVLPLPAEQENVLTTQSCSNELSPIEITQGDITIKVSNQINPELLQVIIHTLGGSL